MSAYNPLLSAVDNTGPQKNTAELLNTYIQSTRTDPEKKFDWLDDSITLGHVLNPIIGGFDFSGGKKPTYLIAGRLMIEAGLFTWPKWVSGMRSQLTNYDPLQANLRSLRILWRRIVCRLTLFKVGSISTLRRWSRTRQKKILRSWNKSLEERIDKLSENSPSQDPEFSRTFRSPERDVRSETARPPKSIFD
jgi:hypothetical protein